MKTTLNSGSQLSELFRLNMNVLEFCLCLQAVCVVPKKMSCPDTEQSYIFFAVLII